MPLYYKQLRSDLYRCGWAGVPPSRFLEIARGGDLGGTGGDGPPKS